MSGLDQNLQMFFTVFSKVKRLNMPGLEKSYKIATKHSAPHVAWCDALNLVLTKSQKKLLKKVAKFLKTPDGEEALDDHHKDNTSSRVGSDCVGVSERHEVADIPQPLSPNEKILLATYQTPEGNNDQRKSGKQTTTRLETPLQSSRFQPGLGEDESKPKCKKAKFLRLQRREEKMAKQGLVTKNRPSATNITEKKLEDYIAESETGTTAHKLTLTIVPSCSDEEILQECYILYKKYQTVIHNDPEDKCNISSFTNFLVSSPLQPYKDADSPPCGYGSFHQLYRLDGKLIAVGVIDVLPKCISSVYFFYDPQYSQLSLGTYGSLRELELARKFAETCPNINQYYLGFYIHSCSKMRYKGNIKPSYLLCPEVYSWHPIDLCLKKLDESKYSRLNDDANARPEDDCVNIDDVPILTKRVIVPFSVFKIKKDLSPAESETVSSHIREYAKLVGDSMARKLFIRWR